MATVQSDTQVTAQIEGSAHRQHTRYEKPSPHFAHVPHDRRLRVPGQSATQARRSGDSNPAGSVIQPFPAPGSGPTAGATSQSRALASRSAWSANRSRRPAIAGCRYERMTAARYAGIGPTVADPICHGRHLRCRGHCMPAPSPLRMTCTARHRLHPPGPRGVTDQRGPLPRRIDRDKRHHRPDRTHHETGNEQWHQRRLRATIPGAQHPRGGPEQPPHEAPKAPSRLRSTGTSSPSQRQDRGPTAGPPPRHLGHAHPAATPSSPDRRSSSCRPTADRQCRHAARLPEPTQPRFP